MSLSWVIRQTSSEIRTEGAKAPKTPSSLRPLRPVSVSRNDHDETPVGGKVAAPHDGRRRITTSPPLLVAGVDDEAAGLERRRPHARAPTPAHDRGDVPHVGVDAADRRQPQADGHRELSARAEADMLRDALADFDGDPRVDLVVVAEASQAGADLLQIVSDDGRVGDLFDHHRRAGTIERDAEASVAPADIVAEVGEAQVQPAAGRDRYPHRFSDRRPEHSLMASAIASGPANTWMPSISASALALAMSIARIASSSRSPPGRVVTVVPSR